MGLPNRDRDTLLVVSLIFFVHQSDFSLSNTSRSNLYTPFLFEDSFEGALQLSGRRQTRSVTISHRGEIDTRYDEIIQVEKRRGFVLCVCPDALRHVEG